MTKKKKKLPGPEPDRLKIEGEWQAAVRKGLKKKRPKEGWPEQEKDQEKQANN